MKAVLSIFSPIVRISPPLGQMCLDMERDVRRGHRAKSQGILNRLKDTLRHLCRKTLRKRTYFIPIIFDRTILSMLRALEWCPFLTSQLRKCQISDASHWLVSNEPTRQKFVQRGLKRKNLKISVTFSARKKKGFNISENFFRK